MVVVPVFLALHTRSARERRWPVYLGGVALLYFGVQAQTMFAEEQRFAGEISRLNEELEDQRKTITALKGQLTRLRKVITTLTKGEDDEKGREEK